MTIKKLESVENKSKRYFIFPPVISPALAISSRIVQRVHSTRICSMTKIFRITESVLRDREKSFVTFTGEDDFAKFSPSPLI